MTAHKHLKARVRARMQRTGESYTTARRIVLAGRADDAAVLELDDDAGTARLADLAAAPVVVDQATLAAARTRIRTQRHRVLAVIGAARADMDLWLLTCSSSSTAREAD